MLLSDPPLDADDERAHALLDVRIPSGDTRWRRLAWESRTQTAPAFLRTTSKPMLGSISLPRKGMKRR